MVGVAHPISVRESHSPQPFILVLIASPVGLKDMMRPHEEITQYQVNIEAGFCMFQDLI